MKHDPVGHAPHNPSTNTRAPLRAHGNETIVCVSCYANNLSAAASHFTIGLTFIRPFSLSPWTFAARYSCAFEAIGELPLRLIQRRLESSGIDLEKQVPFFDKRAFLVSLAK